MKRRTNAQRPRGVPLWLLLATVVAHTAWTQQGRCCCCCCFVLLHARTPDMMQSACMLHNIFFHAHALIAGAARVLMSKCCSCCPVCYDENEGGAALEDEGGAAPLAEAVLVIVLMHMDTYHEEWKRSLDNRQWRALEPTARALRASSAWLRLHADSFLQTACIPCPQCARPRLMRRSIRVRSGMRECPCGLESFCGKACQRESQWWHRRACREQRCSLQQQAAAVVAAATATGLDID